MFRFDTRLTRASTGPKGLPLPGPMVLPRRRLRNQRFPKDNRRFRPSCRSRAGQAPFSQRRRLRT
jgi:hypothetical protein